MKILKITMIFIVFSLFLVIGSVSAENNISLTENTYSSYFNNSGDIILNNINDGDNLDISGSITNKNIKVSKALNIYSSDGSGKLINSTITIFHSGSGSNITGLTIVNSNPNGHGIHLTGTENNTIKNCNLTINSYNAFSMPIVKSNYNKIINNTMINLDNGQGTGQTHSVIVLGDSHYNKISDNTLTSHGSNCIYLCTYGFADYTANDGRSTHNIISNNTVFGADTSWCYSIQLMGDYNTVTMNTITGAYYCISSEGSYNNITKNKLNASNTAIVASKGSNNNISENIINQDNNANGIRPGSDSIVENNQIYVINGIGIDVSFGKNVTIKNNVISTNAGSGIYVFAASDNVIIKNNTVNSNSGTNILIRKSSSTVFPKNIIIENNTLNTNGIYSINAKEMDDSLILGSNTLSSSILYPNLGVIGSIVDFNGIVHNIHDYDFYDYFEMNGQLRSDKISDGDILNFIENFYNKDLFITSQVKIIGESAVLYNSTITITAFGVWIEDLTIINIDKIGFILVEAGNVVLFNNIIDVNHTTTAYGIYLFQSNNNKILSNNITVNGDLLTYGILSYGSNSNLIDGNIINFIGTGQLYGYDADGVCIDGGICIDGEICIDGANIVPEIFRTYGILLIHSSDNNITNNNISGTSSVDIFVDVSSGFTNSMAGIDIYFDSHNNNVIGNNIVLKANDPFLYGMGVLGAETGIGITKSENNSFINNNVLVKGGYFTTGFISGYNSYYTQLFNNTINCIANNYTYGITLEMSQFNSIENNKVNVSAENNYVVELFMSNDNSIVNNTLTALGDYSYGIAAYNSNGNNILQNDINVKGDSTNDPSWHVDAIPKGNAGIYLMSSSNNNNILNNNIISSGDYAIDISDTSYNSIKDNHLGTHGGNKGSNVINVINSQNNIIENNQDYILDSSNGSSNNDSTESPSNPTVPNNSNNNDNNHNLDNNLSNKNNTLIDNEKNITDIGVFTEENQTKSNTNNLPDLIITSIKKSGNYNYKITIKNQGKAASKATKIKIWYGKNYNVYNVKPIAAGKSITIEVKFYKHSDQAKFTKYTQINFDKSINESNYNNNKVSFKSDYQRYKADLIVTKIKKSENKFKVTIKNQGKANSNKFMVKYGSGKNFKIKTVKSIAINKSVVLTLDFSKYSSTKYLKFVQVNYNNTLLESNYKNNLKRFKKGVRY